MGAFIGLISMVLGLITLLAIIAAPWLMPLFAPGLDPALVDETVQLARIMFPIVALLGLTGLVIGGAPGERRSSASRRSSRCSGTS